MTRVVTDMVVSTQSTWEYNMGKENIGSITRPTLFLQKEELERREFIHPIKLRAELDLNWLSMEAESLRKFVREDATISVTTRVMGKDTTFSLSGFSYAVSYTHLRAHETSLHLVCRLLLEKKNYN
eukprot:TRINITY_DN66437_c0_g1_i3.p2 TRINITY_DN66437_c0_g1~~TRINITY_DN66437_c0_g1_i3.p2  ORF type:complete len:126 (-),score=27.34 TRINITY_DN66437_c0_g1_i3:47-424(-)